MVQLLNSGQLPRDFWDWDFSAGFSWGPDAEEEGEAAAAAGQSAAPKHTINQLMTPSIELDH